MGVDEDRQGGENQVSDTLVNLLSTPETHRQPEDVFEIANGLFRASFVQQLDICTRFGRGVGDTRQVECAVPLSYCTLSREADKISHQHGIDLRLIRKTQVS